MSPNDFLGIGKILPLEKLLEVASKGCGRLTKHWFDRTDTETEIRRIREVAEAKADAKRTDAIADADVMTIMAEKINELKPLVDKIGYDKGGITLSRVNAKIIADLPDLPEGQQIRERVIYQDRKRQSNLENITSYAARFLLDKEPVPDIPVDEDWIAQFFRTAEDVSTEQMQLLWGKILAGEIEQSRSFSLRTLDVVKVSSLEERKLFSRHSIACSGDAFLLNSEHLPITGGGFNVILNLRLAGFLCEGNVTSVDFLPDVQYPLGAKYRLTVSGKATVQAIPLTTAGKELARIIEYPEDENIENNAKQIAENIYTQNEKIFVSLIGEKGDVVWRSPKNPTIEERRTSIKI